jgi:hypothetical protein
LDPDLYKEQLFCQSYGIKMDIGFNKKNKAHRKVEKLAVPSPWWGPGVDKEFKDTLQLGIKRVRPFQHGKTQY